MLLDPGMPTPALRIVIVAPKERASFADGAAACTEPERSRALRIGLLETGHDIVAVLPPDIFLAERLSQIQPDMIVVDAEQSARDALEHVVIATRDERRPIVLFTDDSDLRHVPDAIAAGVVAYVVDGFTPERVNSVLGVAMARFEHEERLRGELAQARNQLSERKLIERAKGVLMQRSGLSENDAFARLRKTAMDKGMKLADVAQRVVEVEDLL